jgi:predicted site-specific integrase-resolvase
MHKTTTYITAKRIQEQYEVSTSTLRNWENEGKIEAKWTP